MTDQLPIYLDRIISAKENLSAQDWTTKPTPEKWSKKEILGHLIDSAMHNVKRFYDIKHHVGDYQVVPYPQDNLVRLRKYNEMPLNTLFDSLKNLNLEIHNCVSQYSSEDRAKIIIYQDGNSHTAEWLADDYVAHFKHHLQQIFGPEILL